MYAETLQKYAHSRGGVCQVTGRTVLDGVQVGGVVRAIIVGDDGSVYHVTGFEDRVEEGGRAHVMRLLVSRDQALTSHLRNDPTYAVVLMREALANGNTLDPTQCYFLEGGRELKALLECRPFESRGNVVTTEWYSDLQGVFSAYHASVAAVKAYASDSDGPSEAGRVAVAAYSGSDEDEAPDVSASELQSAYGQSEEGDFVEPEMTEAMSRYAAIGAALADA